MRDLLPDQASESAAHPWSGLERALLVRGATSVMVSERGDSVSIRFAVDDRLVHLEVPTQGDSARVDWSAVQKLLMTKLDAARTGRSSFSSEFPVSRPGRVGPRAGLIGSATVAAFAVALALPLFASGALKLPATAVRLIKAPFVAHPAGVDEDDQRPDRLVVRPPTTASGHAGPRHGARPSATPSAQRSSAARRGARQGPASPTPTTVVDGVADLRNGEAVVDEPKLPPGQDGAPPPGRAKDGQGPASPEQTRGQVNDPGSDHGASSKGQSETAPGKEQGGSSTGSRDPDDLGQGKADPGGTGPETDEGNPDPGGGGNGDGAGEDSGTGTPPGDHGSGGSPGQGGQGGGQDSGDPGVTTDTGGGTGGKGAGVIDQ